MNSILICQWIWSFLLPLTPTVGIILGTTIASFYCDSPQPVSTPSPHSCATRTPMRQVRSDLLLYGSENYFGTQTWLLDHRSHFANIIWYRELQVVNCVSTWEADRFAHVNHKLCAHFIVSWIANWKIRWKTYDHTCLFFKK